MCVDSKCMCKTKKRSESEKKLLDNRLSRIEGQIRGLRKMIENDAYCTDVLMQVSAATSALSSFNKSLLKMHITTCVVQDIKNGKDGAVDELADVLQKLMK